MGEEARATFLLLRLFKRKEEKQSTLGEIPVHFTFPAGLKSPRGKRSQVKDGRGAETRGGARHYLQASGIWHPGQVSDIMMSCLPRRESSWSACSGIPLDGAHDTCHVLLQGQYTSASAVQ